MKPQKEMIRKTQRGSAMAHLEADRRQTIKRIANYSKALVSIKKDIRMPSHIVMSGHEIGGEEVAEVGAKIGTTRDITTEAQAGTGVENAGIEETRLRINVPGIGSDRVMAGLEKVIEIIREAMRGEGTTGSIVNADMNEVHRLVLGGEGMFPRKEITIAADKDRKFFNLYACNDAVNTSLPMMTRRT